MLLTMTRGNGGLGEGFKFRLGLLILRLPRGILVEMIMVLKFINLRVVSKMVTEAFGMDETA